MSRLSGYYLETSWNPSNTGANNTSTASFTVPGARRGDFVLSSLDSITAADMQNAVVKGEVTADDTVTMQVASDGSGVDIAVGTLRIKVVPKDAI